jgi:hypothetical protein
LGSRLSAFLPEYDVAREYRLAMAAPADVVYAAVRALDLGESWLIRRLFALRRIPESALTLSGLERIGFAVLAEEPGQELVLGLIGRFWRTRGDVVRTDPDHFRAFHEPGYAKAAWNFRVLPGRTAGVVLATETRVRCTDEVSREAFRRYWRLIGPFSGWIRRETLRIVKRRAEAGSPPRS